jgi:hypothetical protein
MNWLLSNWTTVVEIVGGALAVASTVTALTPTPADDAVLAKIVAFFSFLTHKNAPGTLKMPLVPHK